MAIQVLIRRPPEMKDLRGCGGPRYPMRKALRPIVMRSLALVITAAALASCFESPVSSGTIACGDDDLCPLGLDCVTGLCVTPGTLPIDAGSLVDGSPDARAIDAGPPDAMVPLGPFGAPVVLGQFDAPAQLEDDPSVTGDLLELYYNLGNVDVMVSTRATPGAAWGAPTEIFAGLGNVEAPYVLASGLTIYLAIGAGDNTFQLYRSTRATRVATWGAVQLVGSPISIAGSDELGPCVTSDDLVMIFASDRAANGVFRLYRSERATIGDAWGTPVALSSIVGADGVELDCWVADGETDLFFGSNRSGGTGNVNIWHAEGDGAGGYSTVTEVSELSTANAVSADPFLSPDQHVIFFSKQLPGDDGDINTSIR